MACLSLYLLQELGLCGGWIANDADVDVTTKGGSLARRLWHAPKQHEEDASLDLLVAVQGGEEAVDQVLVEGLVLRHLVDGVPLGGRHPLLDLLRG